MLDRFERVYEWTVCAVTGSWVLVVPFLLVFVVAGCVGDESAEERARRQSAVRFIAEKLYGDVDIPLMPNAEVVEAPIVEALTSVPTQESESNDSGPRQPVRDPGAKTDRGGRW